jgi:hypothetical protein
MEAGYEVVVHGGNSFSRTVVVAG